MRSAAVGHRLIRLSRADCGVISARATGTDALVVHHPSEVKALGRPGEPEVETHIAPRVASLMLHGKVYIPSTSNGSVVPNGGTATATLEAHTVVGRVRPVTDMPSR